MEFAAIGGRIGNPEPPLAPEEARELLHKVGLRWPHRAVLFPELEVQGLVFLFALPWEHGVAREQAVPHRVVAGRRCCLRGGSEGRCCHA